MLGVPPGWEFQLPPGHLRRLAQAAHWRRLGSPPCFNDIRDLRGLTMKNSDFCEKCGSRSSHRAAKVIAAYYRTGSTDRLQVLAAHRPLPDDCARGALMGFM